MSSASGSAAASADDSAAASRALGPGARRRRQRQQRRGDGGDAESGGRADAEERARNARHAKEHVTAHLAKVRQFNAEWQNSLFRLAGVLFLLSAFKFYKRVWPDEQELKAEEQDGSRWANVEFEVLNIAIALATVGVLYLKDRTMAQKACFWTAALMAGVHFCVWVAYFFETPRDTAKIKGRWPIAAIYCAFVVGAQVYMSRSQAEAEKAVSRAQQLEQKASGNGNTSGTSAKE